MLKDTQKTQYGLTCDAGIQFIYGLPVAMSRYYGNTLMIVCGLKTRNTQNIPQVLNMYYLTGNKDIIFKMNT